MALTVSAIACGGSRRPQGGAAELLAALGPRRPVEPRLAGQTAYALCLPVPAVLGKVPDALSSALPHSGSADWNALERVARRLHDLRHPTAQEIQAQGIGKLLQRRQEGKADEAVETLRRASAADPKDARIWSDLAAAYYVRAQQENEPQDLLFGLSAAGTAVDLAPTLPEALFNRALLLDRLYLRGEAEAAWKRYLEVDAKSPWAGEALAHLRELAMPSTPELWRRQLPALRQAALAGEDGRVQAMIAVSPQAAREYAVEEVLGGWGRDVLAGRVKEAAEALRVAGAIGKALVGRGGDGTVAESVAVLDRATGQPDLLLRLARGHRAYALGVAHFGTLQVENAEAPFREARDTLGPADSPVGLWAEIGLAGSAYYGSQLATAAIAFSSILARTELRRFPALAGRAVWGLGSTRLRQGRLSESLASFQTAAANFVRATESENLGAAQALLAENFRFLGDDSTAWKLRYQALFQLRNFPTSLRLHTLLWETAYAALEQVDPRVALVFQNEDVGVAETSKNPRMIAEALLWRGRIQAAMGGMDAALTDLHQADFHLAQAPGGVVNDKLRADLLFTRGEVERQRDPRRALVLLDEALAFFQQQQKRLVLNLALTHLSRARAALATGLEEVAEADLDAAIDLFERQRATVTSDELRLSYTDAVQELFDERILLEERRQRSSNAFGIAERARNVPLESPQGAEPPPAPVTVSVAWTGPDSRLSELPEKVAFVEYAWTRDRLLCWTVRRGGIESCSITVAPRTLDTQIRAMADALRNRSNRELERSLTVLFESLVPKVVRAMPADVQIFFIPDKALNQIPFVALRNPGTRRYLVEEHASVGVVPSLTFYLQALREPGATDPRDWRALLVGNPDFDRGFFQSLGDLSQSEAETAEIEKLYPGARVLRGPSATKASFLASLDGQEILEYAGHAIHNPKHPAYSHLVLASSRDPEDHGILYAHELARTRLKKLRLVVLSACHTIAARDLRIGGLSGIARPFLDAGARAVLGTLWDVDDAIARKVLPEFHRSFRNSGNATAALHETQLMLLRSTDPILHSPAVWGAFEVIGVIRSGHRSSISTIHQP